MKTLPEGAQRGGAGRRRRACWRQFLQLTLPLCRPPLAALATLEFTWIYNDFFWATVLLQSGDKFPITSSLNNLRGQFFTDNNLVAAGSMVVALPAADRLLHAAEAVRLRPDAGRHQGMTEPRTAPPAVRGRRASAGGRRQRRARRVRPRRARGPALGPRPRRPGVPDPSTWRAGPAAQRGSTSPPPLTAAAPGGGGRPPSTAPALRGGPGLGAAWRLAGRSTSEGPRRARPTCRRRRRRR